MVELVDIIRNISSQYRIIGNKRLTITMNINYVKDSDPDIITPVPLVVTLVSITSALVSCLGTVLALYSRIVA